MIQASSDGSQAPGPKPQARDTHVPRPPLLHRPPASRSRSRRDRGAGRSRARSGRDPSPRHRGGWSRPALHQRHGRVVSAGHQSLRHGKASRARVRHAPAGADQTHRPSGRDAAASVSCQALGARATSASSSSRSARDAKGPVPFSTSSQPTCGSSRLPVVTCWPEDGGPFITLPLVYTAHPDRPGHNLGMYRLQVYDERSTGMHWQIGKGGGFHYARAEAQGTGACRSRCFSAVRRRSSSPRSRRFPRTCPN